MAEIRGTGLCIMGCGRPGTVREKLYCKRCFDKARRGGFDQEPRRIRVKAAKDPKTGKIIRRQHYRWMMVRSGRHGEWVPLAVAKRELDPRPRCKVARCDNIVRRKGLCSKHYLPKAQIDAQNARARKRYADQRLAS